MILGFADFRPENPRFRPERPGSVNPGRRRRKPPEAWDQGTTPVRVIKRPEIRGF